jgi:hypothetical protein
VELPPVPFIAKSQQPFRQHGDLGFLWGLIRGIHVVSEKIRWQSGGYKKLLGCRSLCPLTLDERSPSLAGTRAPGRDPLEISGPVGPSLRAALLCAAGACNYPGPHRTTGQNPFRPFRATSIRRITPGRCPGLSPLAPLGPLQTRTSQTNPRTPDPPPTHAPPPDARPAVAAPSGPHAIAQGNALGFPSHTVAALKGRNAPASGRDGIPTVFPRAVGRGG